MKILLISSLACLPLLLLPACQSQTPTKSVAPGAMSAMPDIGKLLAGVKDVSTANAAKGPLDAAIGKLKDALGGIPGQAQQQVNATGGDLKSITSSLTSNLLSSFGLGAGTMSVLNSLMGNASIAGVLGSSLTQLKNLLPGM